ncbi:MAG: peptidase, partial [Ilumatobacteraceae bacterium]
VRHYLQAHAYGNTETSDLWDALESTSGQPVRDTMDSWIWQAGYPVISVTLDGDELVVRQRKFSFADSSDDTTWMVPVSYRTASGTSSLLLSDDEQRVQV